MMRCRRLARRVPVSLLLMSVMHMPFIYASDGRMTFSGGVTAQTCSISINGKNRTSAAVQLPTVSKASINGSSGQTKGDTEFNFTLSQCRGGNSTMGRVYFVGGAHVGADGRLENMATGGSVASGVALQLYDAGMNAIRAGDTSQLSTPAVSLNHLMQYSVQYMTTSNTVVPGAFATNVTYSISYE
jgi:major type 1 subunit fimbrin (pilin)